MKVCTINNNRNDMVDNNNRDNGVVRSPMARSNNNNVYTRDNVNAIKH